MPEKLQKRNAGGDEALSLWPGGGLAISLISYSNSKGERVLLQMVAQVHCSFLMSIPSIFLYYFSYFDQGCNKIPNKKSLKWGVFCLSI